MSPQSAAAVAGMPMDPERPKTPQGPSGRAGDGLGPRSGPGGATVEPRTRADAWHSDPQAVSEALRADPDDRVDFELPATRALEPVDGPECPPGCPGNHDDLRNAPEALRREVAYAHRGEVIPDSGVPVEPRTFDHVLSVRLPTDLNTAVRDLAATRGQSASDLIRWAVAALVDNAGESPTVLAAAVVRIRREAANARLQQVGARRRRDDLAAARHGIRADTLDEAVRLVAGHPEPQAPARPIDNIDTGGLL